jgi:tetratricopeptide (TPR) repeat protein
LKIVIGLAAWLFLLQPSLHAQENGHASRASTRPVRSTDTRNSASRPATPLETALADLRKAQTEAAAALSARAVYDLGDEGRRALLDVCREKALPEATFKGVVGAFEFERNQAILPVLVDLFGGGDAAKDRYLTDRFRAFDAQRAMLGDLLSDLEKSPTVARRRTILHVLAEIVDTPAERMQATRFLVKAFQRAEFQGFAEELTATLRKITFQRHTQPARWQKWLDEFGLEHPEGFTEADLYQSALAERDQRFIAEVKRSINVAIANKQIPDYFNPAQYPEASIRAHAAQEFAGLKEAEADVVNQAVKVLVEALKAEKDEEVICALLKSLGALAENRDEIKEEIGGHLVAYLKDARDAVIVAALKAIAQTGTGSDCHVIEELYEQSGATNADRSTVRAQAVTTLYSLDCGSPTILTALEDASADVRSSAARGLGYGKRKDAAPRIAKALRAEKSEEAQRVMVRALNAIDSWPAEVVDALLEIAGKPGAAREAAVRGLVQAASSGTVDAERADRMVALLCEALPVLAASQDKRKPLLDDFQNAKGPLAVRVLVKWLENETQLDTAKELAIILTRIAPVDPVMLNRHASNLIALGRAAPAIVLLRAALLQTSGAAATTTQSARNPELKVALARALLLERSADGLAEAENIASHELRIKPEDGQLLLLRGAIREALGKRFEAAEDLRRALKTEGVVMADPERQEAERKTALLLLAEDPKKAKEFLDSLPPLPRDRDFLLVLGRVDCALGDIKQAVKNYRAALKAPGKEEANVVRYRLAQALLASHRAEDRLEAKTVFEALEGEPPIADGHPLQPLREAVRSDSVARASVRELDEVAPDGVSSSLATVIALGDKALPWLFHQLAEFARTAPLPAIERRMTAVQSIMATDGPASRRTPLSPPAAGASRETWVEFATRAAAWWDARR